MVLKKLAVFLLLVLSSLNLSATHIIGGEIFYECLGSDNYRITLKVYRDCYNGVPPLDVPAYVTIFDNAGNVLRVVNFLSPVVTNIPPSVNNPCLVLPPNICVEEGVYQEIINLPPIPGGYVLSYQRCCRNNTILNIVNPGGSGATYTTYINDAALQQCNSNPHFKNFPPIGLCINDPLIFDHSAIDPNGDSLAYELCDPYLGANTNDPWPTVGDPPPYSFVSWNSGFSGSYPMTSSPGLAIDPVTGLLTGTPTQLGQYVVGVCVKEYRNGVLMSVNKRDFQFNVVLCNASVATIPTQRVYCDGLKVDFGNSSLHASTFYWDFGDPTSSADNSTLTNPSYTYPDTGQYTVMLIINQGTQCVDTGYSTFGIYPLIPAVANFSNQCFKGNSYNFSAAGTFDSTATFSWNFGASANPSASTLKDPAGIVYNAPGTYPVSITMSAKGCSKTSTQNLEVYPQPVESYVLDPQVACAPFTFHFVDSSNTGNTLIRNWNLGNELSYHSDPTVTYPNPGNYSVSLNMIAETIYGCKDTFDFSFPDIITVNPSPRAGFTVDSSIVSIFEPHITVRDSSFDAVLCQLFFGDGTGSSDCNTLTHTYTKAGTYTITQVVVNSFGCPDTFRLNVIVENAYRFFLPNAFTPNGDGKNDIFKPVVLGVDDYTMLIFNRWGELIFETHDPDSGWDGTFQGKLCPHEVYVYKFNFLDLVNRQRHEFVGGVTLIR